MQNLLFDQFIDMKKKHDRIEAVAQNRRRLEDIPKESPLRNIICVRRIDGSVVFDRHPDNRTL
jgi:hypothetical protein